MTRFIPVENIVGMKLDAYLRQYGVSEKALAEATGYAQGTINKLRNGKINPTLAVLEAIAKATDGAVMPNDFLSYCGNATSALMAETAGAAALTRQLVKTAIFAERLMIALPKNIPRSR
ncbi:helix-turn-helix transcriptional regulator [Methylocystis sp. MJC1]|uniref:helix-turn-helix domain-containing protein n=1 Tax=Methylocystis sp. MJC1 TaxID=2654282 RepID=UPI001C1E6CFE|nr:helix-turn-helix transcriptional regulator [Methylocystis sp. MJC1]